MPLAMFGVKEKSNLRWLVVVRVHSDCAEVATCSWGCEPRHVFAGPGTESRAHPAPSVLLDRSAAENSLEIVVALSTAEDETAAVKSDLIKADDLRQRGDGTSAQTTEKWLSGRNPRSNPTLPSGLRDRRALRNQLTMVRRTQHVVDRTALFGQREQCAVVEDRDAPQRCPALDD